MEPKKNPKVDINKRKGLFLEIGLVVALALVIGAFTVSQQEKKITFRASDRLWKRSK